LQIEETVEEPLQSVALAGERKTGESVESKRAKGKVFEMGWDKLVVAVGCYSQTFGTKGVREHAYFLKDVADARKIRNRLLSCFETASLPTTSEEMKKMLLNFAVVGGGPTGIEWSAELCDMIEEDMSKLYPELVGYAKVRSIDLCLRRLFTADHAKLLYYRSQSTTSPRKSSACSTRSSATSP
jgi:NADH dehydrogenase FAD-containing subunit